MDLCVVFGALGMLTESLNILSECLGMRFGSLWVPYECSEMLSASLGMLSGYLGMLSGFLGMLFGYALLLELSKIAIFLL